MKQSVPVNKGTTTTYQTTIDPEIRHAVFVVVAVESFDFLVVPALSLPLSIFVYFVRLVVTML